MRFAAAAAVIVPLSACGTQQDDRVPSGAGIGAATGAGVGAIFGGVGAIPGALIGAALGAGAGAVTKSDDINLGRPVCRDDDSKG